MANIDLRDFIQYVSTGFASLQDIMNLASDIGIDPQTAISVVQQVQPTMLPTNPLAGNYTAPTQEYSAPRIGFEEAVSIFDPVTERPPVEMPRDPRSYDPGPPPDPISDPFTSRMHGDPKRFVNLQEVYELGIPPHAEPNKVDMSSESFRPGRPRPVRTLEPTPPLPPTPTTLSLTDTITDNISTATGGGLGGSPVVEKDTVNVTEAVSPTTFDTGNMVVDMGDALSVANSPFTNQADRTAAQDYISGIVSNIRMPF